MIFSKIIVNYIIVQYVCKSYPLTTLIDVQGKKKAQSYSNYS